MNFLLPLMGPVAKGVTTWIANASKRKQAKWVTFLLFDLALIILKTLAENTDNQLDDELVAKLQEYRETVK